MLLPDPGRSRAVLLGVPDYRRLAPLPGVAAGVARLGDLLCDPTVWGLPRRHVTVLDGRASADDVLAAVRDAGEATDDTLLVYFAGHGLREPGGDQLYLALADADDDHLAIGTLPYPEVLRVARRAAGRARWRITFLDCCYSGLAIPMGGSGAVMGRAELARLVSEPGDGHGRSGSWLMTSASRTQRSFTPPHGYPYFTGALIDVLESGVPGAGPELGVRDFVRRVEERFQERIRGRIPDPDRPEPQYVGHNVDPDEPWVRNRAHVTPHVVPPRSTLPAAPEEFVDALRLLLMRQHLALVPEGGTEGLKGAWLKRRCQVSGEERLIGYLKSRYARTGEVVFTDTHLCLHSSSAGTRMRIPYSRVNEVSLDTATEEVHSGAATDQTVLMDTSLLMITRVTLGHRTLEFREYHPEPVQKALLAFLPAMAELRLRRPEWFGRPLRHARE
ncbi:caspase family protein [Streptomyces reticuli]|uniref:caspase family protein n=1 Tax=Streptomyces reticuli TaxID=1926 RepID=UPI00073DBA4A|nr:hypothetical protein TUE45_03109 [Streptomyces reticuli]